jgi:hypothetical protein
MKKKTARTKNDVAKSLIAWLESEGRSMVHEMTLKCRQLKDQLAITESKLAHREFRIDILEQELTAARALPAAMREAVLEFERRPPEGEFVLEFYGKGYAMPPERVKGYFEALDACWKSDYVKRWSEEFRTARDRAVYAEGRNSEYRNLLSKATTRLEILAGRMRACDEASNKDAHSLSLFEIEGWVEEQRAAMSPVKPLIPPVRPPLPPPEIITEGVPRKPPE